MKRYTELKQAMHDPSLAMITEDITNQIELNKVYVRYRVLPRRQKRFSNYYSNEFLGHNVPEMYVLVKDKLRADIDIFDGLQLPSETYIVSEPDLYYKEESFNSGDTNICFILGHSGSGKSMMARTLEGDDIDHIELDDLLLTKDHFTMDELKDYSDMFYSFFKGEGAKYYIGVDERNSIPKEEYEDKVFIDFVKFAKDYAGQHKEKKYIIDGIWLYLYFDDPSVFEDYAVFIKGTSFLKSKIRATKREMQRDKETLQDRKEMFGREVRNYLLDEEKINAYRSFYGDRPETIFREESNETAKQDEMVRNELIGIDKCFVNNDAKGIIEIEKKARANAELSNWSKLRIFNECESALFDLGRQEKPVPAEDRPEQMKFNVDDPEINARKSHALIECRMLDATDAADRSAKEAVIRQLFGSCGNDPNVLSGFRCDNGKNIHVGDGFYANYNVTIRDISPVNIGDNVWIEPGTLITTVSCPLPLKGRRDHIGLTKPVTIGNDVWIGGNCTIMPGVTIGNNVVIVAGTVVAKDVPDNCVVGGVPAKKIRDL